MIEHLIVLLVFGALGLLLLFIGVHIIFSVIVEVWSFLDRDDSFEQS